MTTPCHCGLEPQSAADSASGLSPRHCGLDPQSAADSASGLSPRRRGLDPQSAADSTPGLSPRHCGLDPQSPDGPAGGPTPLLVLATHNQGKLAEVVDILRAQPGLADLPDGAIVTSGELDLEPPVEDGTTFGENALIKARAIAMASGLPALADDSGLMVEILGGAPGIFSARWCGRHGDDQANLNLLLAQLAEITQPENRRAAFVCAVALALPSDSGQDRSDERWGTVPVGSPRARDSSRWAGVRKGEETVRVRKMSGRLALAPRGTGGFGYDPIFIADDANDVDAEQPLIPERTNAELSSEEKNAISHRGKALRAIAPVLADLLSDG